MSSDVFSDALILTGPTGCGKTALGVELAERLGAEIISMDSMALYRGLDIAAAKPSSSERQRVPHHLLDVLEPWQSATVHWWLGQAARCCQDIKARGRRVLFVGGTALYLKALLRGLFDGPGADPAVRQRLEEEEMQRGRGHLHAKLGQVDPPSAARLHPNDVRRIVRALEVWETTGRPISEWQQQWNPARSLPLSPEAEERGEEVPRCLCLDRPREELYARINARVEKMVAEGLVEEIAALRQLPQPVSREAAQAVGYREIGAYLDEKIDLSTAVAQIQLRSRQFAKRQLTWFRQLPELRFADEQLTRSLWGQTIG